MPRRWFELTVEAPAAYAESIANFLLESGAPGIEAQDRGDGVCLIAYFSTEPSIELLCRYCDAIGWRAERGAHIRIRPADDQDWANTWKQHTQPQRIGDTLYVTPSWETSTPSDRVVITLDPGMAFGTGHHPTTRGCLELLEYAVQQSPRPRALDLGTGSGILAIALAKLGVAEVWAVDNDPVARAAAQHNATVNGVDHALRIVESLAVTPGRFDLIVANLFADLLIELSTPLSAALEPHGVLICAGFLVGDEARVRDAYEANELVCEKRQAEDSWVTLCLSRTTEQ